MPETPPGDDHLCENVFRSFGWLLSMQTAPLEVRTGSYRLTPLDFTLQEAVHAKDAAWETIIYAKKSSDRLAGPPPRWANCLYGTTPATKVKNHNSPCLLLLWLPNRPY